MYRSDTLRRTASLKISFDVTIEAAREAELRNARLASRSALKNVQRVCCGISPMPQRISTNSSRASFGCSSIVKRAQLPVSRVGAGSNSSAVCRLCWSSPV